jgi:hypothetical protein
MQTTRGSQHRSSDLTTINLLAVDSCYWQSIPAAPLSHLLNHITGFRYKPDALIEPALAIEFRRFARRFPFAHVEARMSQHRVDMLK